MPNSPVLDIPLVAEGQSEKETAINNAIVALEAGCAMVSVAKTTSPQTLSVAQSRSGVVKITGALTADHIIETQELLDNSLIVVNGTTGAFKLEVRAGNTSTLYRVPRGCGVSFRRGASAIELDDRHNLSRPRTAVRLAANKALSASTVTRIDFDTVVSDASDLWDSTNKRFVAPLAGLYLVEARAELSGLTGIPSAYIAIRVGGSEVFRGTSIGGVLFTGAGLIAQSVLSLAANDNVDIVVYQSGSGTAQIDLGAHLTWASFHCLRYG